MPEIKRVCRVGEVVSELTSVFRLSASFTLYKREREVMEHTSVYFINTKSTENINTHYNMKENYTGYSMVLRAASIPIC